LSAITPRSDREHERKPISTTATFRRDPNAQTDKSRECAVAAFGFSRERGPLQRHPRAHAIRSTRIATAGRDRHLGSAADRASNATATAGLLNAKGALDVDPKGGLSGRVDAELRNLRGTFYIGGKLGDPQLRR
jgi:hypothetical protein